MPARRRGPSSAACHRYPRRERSCQLRDRGPDVLHETSHVEAMIGEDFVVRAALRQLGHADARHACRRLEAELGDSARDHVTLTAVYVMVVERHDGTAPA